MKCVLHIALFMFLLAIASRQAYGQSVSPNHLNESIITLFLENGDTVTGKVSLNNEVLISPHIEVKSGSEPARRLHLLDVKGYEKEGAYYELKHTATHFHPRSGFYFMKRLTPKDATMHLYEHLQRKQKGKSMYDVFYEPVYYLQLPGEKTDRVYASFSRKLVPHFYKKMSALVKDCAQLEAKIHNKEPGYVYSRMNATEKKRGEVLLRIAGEYNTCNERSK